MGNDRAEGSSAIGDGGQAAISLTSDTDGTGSVPCWNEMHVCFSEN